MTTAIIGVGNLGGTVARHLVAGDEPVVLAAAGRSTCRGAGGRAGPECERCLGGRRDRGRRRRRARDLARPDQGAGARRSPPAREQGRRRPLEPDRLRRERADDPDAAGRTVVRLRGRRPSPGERRTTSRRSGLSAPSTQLATGANHEPRIVLFYATDDDAAEATAQRLIRAAGFEPLKVGGVSDAGRIEGPDGELQGRIFDLDEARATIATEGVKA